ncbi:hypothetical protein G7085_19240 [Tessaracoccus sp. HDW20]|uniref:hypothetical protein n=1 Tax=Tessaracoccus coleopterorum TaxID=2714950 RepID=UPI0018D3DFE6|nr:hypothetical protein [Tessaracoccus coleopterorum]NHB85958.1 hypothetical protein [Tessaracoccus coleopterorum]
MFVTRERWELILYAGLSILLVLLQQNYFYSSARFLLPTVLPLLPVARFAGRGRGRCGCRCSRC